MSSSNLSLRSTRELQGQPNATAKVIADAWKDLYSADKNPNGVINLGVAENALMQDFLTHDLNYQSLGGSSSFKDAMCHILNRYFNPVVNVKSFVSFESPGQSVPVPSRPPSSIKAVLLCNPHNPMGKIVDEIYGLSVFEEGPQTDNDDGDPETGPNKFISTLSLDPHRLNFDPSRLHVYDSKGVDGPAFLINKRRADFACCGLRLQNNRAGILISQSNPNLLQLIKDLNLNQVQVSSLTEFSFSNLILNNNKAGHDRQDS
ncbi:hypothetical protein KEM48_011263 [Puccinia striiformis f. sp. tritici PST-130]|nr:hypothetical protein KEM48_011263 [Puccinia striiformis f. sp. tritici PST-130]